MDYKRVLTIQDISCVGQCSLTVALPVISACGAECCVLPSSVLSTHTAFSGFTFRDLCDDMPAIRKVWEKEKIKFDAIYTGYLGSIKQIDYVAEIFDKTLKEGGKIIVDPAMADGGRLYTGFDMEYARAMKKICRMADYVMPNLTEACLLTDTPYKEKYDKEYIDGIFKKLADEGFGNIIFTGVSFSEGKTGVAILENGEYSFYEHEKVGGSRHGTGDVYASAFVGALMIGKKASDAAAVAADYTVCCIKETQNLENHWYGVAFERAIPYLIKRLEEND